jgi:hypothetical protein
METSLGMSVMPLGVVGIVLAPASARPVFGVRWGLLHHHLCGRKEGHLTHLRVESPHFVLSTEGTPLI